MGFEKRIKYLKKSVRFEKVRLTPVDGFRVHNVAREHGMFLTDPKSVMDR
jgi:hypothetical protein